MVVFVTVLILWVFSVCLHEFGHAIVAYWGGDVTVKDKGYLTLNPVHYTHPVYSLLLPVVFLMLGGIGLPGGAVYINDRLLRGRGWRTAVSVAGPVMNLVLVFFLCLPFWFGWIDAKPGNTAACSLAFLIQLQIGSVVLCLLPVPPLDGFRALCPWLPGRLQEQLLAQSSLFLMGLFLVLWNVPQAGRALSGVIVATMDSLGISPYLAYQGWQAFQFWN